MGSICRDHLILETHPIKMYRLMFRFFLILFPLFLTVSNLSAQSPEGIWQTIDDKTGAAKSWVEIYKVQQNYYGKVVKLLDAASTTVCTACTGDHKGKPINGMVILTNLKPYKDYWTGGEILDPKSGNTYGCSVWFEDNNYKELKVRGKHWTGLYRDQTWIKVK